MLRDQGRGDGGLGVLREGGGCKPPPLGLQKEMGTAAIEGLRLVLEIGEDADLVDQAGCLPKELGVHP